MSLTLIEKVKQNTTDSNEGMFFLNINENENPIVDSITKVDGKTYIRVSYERFVQYCREYGFTYSNAVNWKLAIHITNELTNNKRSFKILKVANLADIWKCEEDENLFLITSKILDAK